MFLFLETCNLYTATADMARRWSAQSATATFQLKTTGVGRFGGNCILNDHLQASGGTLLETFPSCGEVAGNEFFFSFALGVLNLPAATGTSRPFKMGFDSNIITNVLGSDSHLSLRILGDGTIEAYRQTTLIASSAAGVIHAATWHRVEGKALIHASVGTLEIRVDGVAVITFSGNTKNSGYAASIGAFALTGCNLGGTTPNDDWKIQDIALWRAGGGERDDWMGDFSCTTMFPSADGDTINGTPNTGAAHNAVDDTGAGDADTTYQRLTGIGDKDLFQHTALSATGILGVMTHVYARGDGPGVRSFKHAVKSAGTTYLTAAAQIVPGQASYVNRDDFFADNPATAAPWLTAALDSAQFGYQLTA